MAAIVSNAPDSGDVATRSSSDQNKQNETEGVEKRRRYDEVENLNEIPLWLAPCHMIAALFQFVQALFLFAWSSKVDLTWYVYVNFPTKDELPSEHDFAKPFAQEVGSYPITWYAGVFILLSCIDHVLCILPSVRPYYEYYIERHQSPIRWIEYSLSAPLMRVHIAQVAGVTDVHILWCVFFLGHSAMYFPAMHEKLNAKARADGYTQNWFPAYAGGVPHMASWLVIFCYFFTGLRQADPPEFIGTIVFCLFLLDSCFAICFHLQWKKIGIFKDYLIGEFGFIMLSFTAKTFLAWATLAGANRSRRDSF